MTRKQIRLYLLTEDQERRTMGWGHNLNLVSVAKDWMWLLNIRHAMSNRYCNMFCPIWYLCIKTWNLIHHFELHHPSNNEQSWSRTNRTGGAGVRWTARYRHNLYYMKRRRWQWSDDNISRHDTNNRCEIEEQCQGAIYWLTNADASSQRLTMLDIYRKRCWRWCSMPGQNPSKSYPVVFSDSLLPSVISYTCASSSSIAFVSWHWSNTCWHARSPVSLHFEWQNQKLKAYHVLFCVKMLVRMMV